MRWEPRSHCLGNAWEANSAGSPQSFAHSLIVKGPSPLSAKEITIPDLRAGFAYVMAATLAKGTSKISGLHFLDRGYEKLAAKLCALGVDAVREKCEEKPPLRERREVHDTKETNLVPARLPVC